MQALISFKDVTYTIPERRAFLIKMLFKHIGIGSVIERGGIDRHPTAITPTFTISREDHHALCYNTCVFSMIVSRLKPYFNLCSIRMSH